MITLWVIASYLTKKLCDYMFPERMNRFYFKVGFFAIKIYTPLYLTGVQFVKAFNMYKDRYDQPTILCITNGKVVNKLTGPDMQLHPTCFEQYDLVLYKERAHDENNNYKYQFTRLVKGYSLANLPPPSTVHFVDITVFTNDQKYTLDFGLNNFYVEGNILCDKSFLEWYLSTFFKVDLGDSYRVTIMDADINFISMEANKHIVIKKDGYDIISVETKSNRCRNGYLTYPVF